MNIQKTHQLLNQLYQQSKKLFQSIEQLSIKCTYHYSTGNYIFFDGKYHYQHYPIPVIEIDGMGDIGFDLQKIFFEYSITRQKLTQTKLVKLLNHFSNIEIYGGSDCLIDFYQPTDPPAQVLNRIATSTEEEIMIAIYLDHAMSDLWKLFQSAYKILF